MMKGKRKEREKRRKKERKKEERGEYVRYLIGEKISFWKWVGRI